MEEKINDQSLVDKLFLAKWYYNSFKYELGRGRYKNLLPIINPPKSREEQIEEMRQYHISQVKYFQELVDKKKIKLSPTLTDKDMFIG